MERSSNRSIAIVTLDETDPRDPTANCDRCGARGTVARAVRHTDPPLVLRYCSHCWPDAQDEVEARQHEAAWSSASRSWFDVRRFLALIAMPTKGGPPPTSADLSEIAADIRAKAPEMDGPIPQDVEAFLSSHGPPAA
jgi:hypothetical protein